MLRLGKTNRAILTFLKNNGDTDCHTLRSELNKSKSALSKSLKVLEDRNLIEKKRQGKAVIVKLKARESQADCPNSAKDVKPNNKSLLADTHALRPSLPLEPAIEIDYSSISAKESETISDFSLFVKGEENIVHTERVSHNCIISVPEQLFSSKPFGISLNIALSLKIAFIPDNIRITGDELLSFIQRHKTNCFQAVYDPITGKKNYRFFENVLTTMKECLLEKALISS